MAALSSSRIGKPPISAQTIVDRMHHAPERRKAFEKEAAVIFKIAESVTPFEASDALHKVMARPKADKYLRDAAFGAATVPVLKGVGTMIEAGVNAKAGRGGAALRALQSTSRGSLAKQVAEGAIGGGLVRAVTDGMAQRQARKVVKNYIAQESGKEAALTSPKMVVSAVGDSATRAGAVGKFTGMATNNALKPPSSVIAGVVDPRKSIKSSVAVPR